jgi:hypothetical protein
MADEMPKQHMQLVKPSIPYDRLQLEKPRGGGGSGGTTTTGFGNIRPIDAFNIFNKGGQRIPYTFKWQKYLDINFANEEQPFIIPYYTLAFWTGTWDEQKTQSIWNAKYIDTSTGVEFLESTLAIEVYAVTRQRILQTGNTNVETFDMETSEGLHITLADREATTLFVRDLRYCGPTGENTLWSAGYHSYEDSYTHHHKWSRTFPWPRLQHGYIWDIPNAFYDASAYTAS